MSWEGAVDEVVARLKTAYVFDRFGNPRDPLEDLVYILLSTRTRQETLERTYFMLKEQFPSWELVMRTPVSDIERVLAPAGLSLKKSRWLKALLQEIHIREGTLSLGCLRTMSDESAEQYLTSLPGVGVKTARCVLMYALDRAVLPVDANVRRLLERLGLLDPKTHYSVVHNIVQSAVPARMRSDLHIYAILHGRARCFPRNPDCEGCALQSLCPAGI